ncbi:MAG: inositol monophosphatase family protein [Ktedonobacteraceae bacterium]
MHSERFNQNEVYFRSSEHTTMKFDREAEDIIINGLSKSGTVFEVITEERAACTTGPAPEYRIVIDPVDGSTNVARGIMTATVALAILPIDVPIHAEQVQWALVGDLYTGTVYQAQRGGGAYRNGRRCSVSATRTLEDSIIGINFDGRDMPTIGKLLMQQPAIGTVRRSGSSAMDIAYVASGAYDAFVDIGDILTAESFLASLSIVLEAGGIVSDQNGNNLRDITNLSEGYSLVVAGTGDLHSALIQRIRNEYKHQIVT